MTHTLTILNLLNIPEENSSDYIIKINKNTQTSPVLSWYINVDDQKLYSYINTHKGNTKRANFVMHRKHVIQLIEYGRNKWMFIGVYGGDYELIPSPVENGATIYNFDKYHEFDSLSGRLIFSYKRKQGPTNGHFRAEDVAEEFELVEMLPSRKRLEFPGYDNVDLTWHDLKTIITTNDPDWYAALSNIKAIYLQTDRATGKSYVGSAYGKDMLWGRWRDYAETYHGGNKSLVQLYNELGSRAFEKNFHYHILEVFPPKTDDGDIINREHWWMNTLDTIRHGYNN